MESGRINTAFAFIIGPGCARHRGPPEEPEIDLPPATSPVMIDSCVEPSANNAPAETGALQIPRLREVEP